MNASMDMGHALIVIQVASEAFAEKRMVLRSRQKELEAQARFLEQEMANNK